MKPIDSSSRSNVRMPAEMRATSSVRPCRYTAVASDRCWSSSSMAGLPRSSMDSADNEASSRVSAAAACPAPISSMASSDMRSPMGPTATATAGS
jgi:hypothetical protein